MKKRLDNQETADYNTTYKLKLLNILKSKPIQANIPKRTSDRVYKQEKDLLTLIRLQTKRGG